MAQLSRALAFFVLLLAAPMAHASDLFAGDWVGKGETRAWDDAFDMTLHIAPDGAGSLVYRGAGGVYRCDVKWTLTGKSARRAEYRETVVSGPCEDGGGVTITRQPDGLAYSWTKRVSGRPVRATGKLWRAPALTS